MGPRLEASEVPEEPGGAWHSRWKEPGSARSTGPTYKQQQTHQRRQHQVAPSGTSQCSSMTTASSLARLLLVLAAAACLFAPTEQTTTATCGVAACFVIDESGSILAPNFVKAKAFVASVISNISAISSTSQYGASRFNESASPVVGLASMTTNSAAAIASINNIQYGEGATNTEWGLAVCFDGNGGIITNNINPNLPRLVLLLTDGLPNRRRRYTVNNTVDGVDCGSCTAAICGCSGSGSSQNCACNREAASRSAQVIRGAQIRLVSIAVGPDVDLPWLRSISDFVFNVSGGYDDLGNIVGDITEAACSDVGVSLNCGSSTTVGVGDNTTLPMTLRNTGAYAVQTALSFSVTLGSGLSLQSVQATGGAPPATCGLSTQVNSSKVYACSVAASPTNPIAPSTSQQYSIVIRGDSSGTWTTAVEIKPAADNDATNNNASCTTTVTVPDVTISKAPATVSVPINGTGTYTITVGNVGSQPASNVVVKETLPPGLEYVPGTAGCTAAVSANVTVVTCNINNTIAVGANASLPIVVKPSAPGTFITSASVTAANEQNTSNNGPVNNTITVVRTCAVYNTDGSGFNCGSNPRNPANNNNTSPSDAICCITEFPDVTISKAPATVSVPINGTGTYTITVRNVGNQTASNVVVKETLPPGLEYVPGTAGCTAAVSANVTVVTCNINNTIAVGANASLPIVVKPSAPGTFITSASVTAADEQNTSNNGPVNNTITVVRTCAVYNTDGSGFNCGSNPRNPANNNNTSPSDAICCITEFPDVTISKAPATVSVPINGTGTYTITVRNVGNQTASNVVVKETLPPGLEYVPGTAGCTAAVSANVTVVTCNINNTIAVGANASLPIVVKPSAPGTFITSASVTAADEQNTSNNGPVNNTIIVVRTCAVYNTDGSGFNCGSNPRNPANNNNTSPTDAICCVQPLPGPVYSLDKRGPGQATAGTPFTFTIEVTINAAVSGVTITDTMQAGLVFAAPGSWSQTVGGSRSGGCSIAGLTMNCTLGNSWAAGDKVLVTVPAVGSSSGTFLNTASVQVPGQAAVTDTESVFIFNVPPIPLPVDVVVAKRVVGSSNATLGSGDPPTFTFEVKLRAATGTAVPNPTLTDTMSAGLQIQGDISASNGGTCTPTALGAFTCSWAGSTLTPANDFVVTYTARAMNAGTFTNRAESNPPGDLTPGNNVAQVTVTVNEPPPGPPVLVVSKTGPTSAKVGENITFVVTAGLAAGSPAAAVLVLDEELSSTDVQFVLPIPDANNCKLQTPQKVQCTWNSVTPADIKVLLFTVRGIAATTFTNTARVSSTGSTPKNASVITTLLPEPIPLPAVIRLEKSGPGKVVNAGEQFDFTLKASVVSGNVTTMILVDRLPDNSGLKFVKSNPATACDVKELVATCTLTAPFPQTIKLTTVGTVSGTFTNQAQLTAGSASSNSAADVTVFIATCGQVTPGGGPFKGCPSGFEYDPLSAGKSPPNPALCCKAKAQATPDISVTKVVNDASVLVGADVIFTIQVKHNKGSQDTLAQNVIMKDTLPVGLRPYADSWTVTPDVGPDACTFDAANVRIFSCALGTIPSGETRTISVRCLADGSRLGALSNVATVSCDKAGEGVPDPKCNKQSPPAVVTVTKPPPPPCVASLAIDIIPRPNKAPTGAIITWDIILTPRNGTVYNVSVVNPIPKTLASPTFTRNPADGCKFIQTNGQSVLQCLYAAINTPFTVQYTTRANAAGAVSNSVEAKYKSCPTTQDVISIRNTNTVVIWAPIIGSCCDKDNGCTAGVARGLCLSRGGAFTKDLTACFTGRFCTGACCINGGSLTAQCLTTTKAGCTGKWDPAATCFDSSYCPSPCLTKCQPCDMRSDTCCPGFHCGKSGKFGRAYCLPDCVPYKPACSGAGGLCGISYGGNQCCKGLDCIVGGDGTGVCTPRQACKPPGSACGGFGECASGLFCAPTGKCALAQCASKGKKFPRSASAQASKNAFHYQCQAVYDASCSGL
ncbi:hypothetical protein OEZ86_007268 [Tetradesmus obliquus]|nr:hypothetical protein OEZ86_007268 [Tetradesmus obliquus]